MNAFRELLACPACTGALSADWTCLGCGTAFDAPDGIPNLRLPADPRTAVVRRFYERAPFPGYPERDSLHALHARAERSAFARLVNRAIPGDARIAEIGCGTGQMSLYLARADRVVIGADLARGSLRLGAAAARRFGIDRVQFVETDLGRPGLRAGSFDVVYSSGVLHHTPNPRASFARLAQLARPGGIIVVGLYNAFARIPLAASAGRCARSRVFASSRSIRCFAPAESDPARREAWLRDQYQHPEEHRHTLAEVQDWFAENRVEYLRAYPSAVLEDEPADLFEPAPDNWRPEGWLAQLGWIATLGHEGGLFFTIGRRSMTLASTRSSASLRCSGSPSSGNCASRNVRRLKAAGGIEIGRRHYPLLVALHVAWLVAIAAGIRSDTHVSVVPLLAFVLFQGLRLWVLATLGRFWTTRVIVVPDAPLVRHGPYRFLRHPNYVVVAGEIALLPLVFGEVVTAVVFSAINAVVLAWRIHVEEATLRPRRNLGPATKPPGQNSNAHGQP